MVLKHPVERKRSVVTLLSNIHWNVIYRPMLYFGERVRELELERGIKPFICRPIRHIEPSALCASFLKSQTNGPSDQWVPFSEHWTVGIVACRSNGKYFGPLRRRNNEASELRSGPGGLACVWPALAWPLHWSLSSMLTWHTSWKLPNFNTKEVKDWKNNKALTKFHQYIATLCP